MNVLHYFLIEILILGKIMDIIIFAKIQILERFNNYEERSSLNITVYREIFASLKRQGWRKSKETRWDEYNYDDKINQEIKYFIPTLQQISCVVHILSIKILFIHNIDKKCYCSIGIDLGLIGGSETCCLQHIQRLLSVFAGMWQIN